MVNGPTSAGYAAERLDHLGTVTGVCRETGLAEWLDGQETKNHALQPRREGFSNP